MMRIAQGTACRGSGKHRLKDSLRVVVTFDKGQFEEIRQRAIKKQTSFAEQVRLLVEWGFEA